MLNDDATPQDALAALGFSPDETDELIAKSNVRSDRILPPEARTDTPAKRKPCNQRDAEADALTCPISPRRGNDRAVL